MSRVLLTFAFVLGMFCVARPAAALLPEPYVGIGAAGARYGSELGVAFTAEAGVDDIISSLGVGLRVELPSFDPILLAELRYSIIKLPFVRLLAGLHGGVEHTTKDWNGALGAFVGGRVSLGVPYLAATVGVSSAGEIHPYATVTLGVSF